MEECPALLKVCIDCIRILKLLHFLRPRTFFSFSGTARGVPMLFIPFFGDQYRNALKCVATGNALMQEFSTLTIDSFSAVLQEMLENKTYYYRAKELASIFNDNLVHPLEEAIFWIEYVIRSNGAKHLKSNAVNISWFSYLLLDILIVPFVAIFLVYFIIKFACRKNEITKNKSKKKQREKKTK